MDNFIHIALLDNRLVYILAKSFCSTASFVCLTEIIDF